MVPVVFVGVALVSGLGRSDSYGSNPLGGTVYGILTGLTYTIFLLAFRQAGRQRTPPVGPLLDATIGATAVSLVMGLAFDPEFSWVPTWPAHGWLLALALLSQVLGWLLLARALPRLPALETSVLLLMQPVLTVLWALWIFAERLSGLQWAGVLLVLGGIGMLSVLGSVVRPSDPALSASKIEG
jgi:drug/metabolite transporter (DMT)-like permease